MRVLFAASEIFPYAKTGGLADVAYALPLALKKVVEISRVMPLYGFMNRKSYTLYDNFTVTLRGEHYAVAIYCKEERGIVTYFVHAPYLSETEHLYGDASGDYVDNALRFGIFCMAIVELGIRLNVALIHLNDWHTALVALYVESYALNIKTVFTIHNLAYQGIFEKESLKMLGISRKYFTMETLEFYGKVNFMKAGIAFADAVTTVSPSYAREILTEKFGCGLDGFLKVHDKKITGILNGIDYEMFPPLQKKESKVKTKRLFCERFGFKDLSLPLFVMVSRLVAQKGTELLRDVFKALADEEINLFILGEGEQEYCTFLEEQTEKYNNFAFFQGYDERLSRETYLASDFLLMPSLFEPCGLNQFIAMRQGSIPVVHAVGGLRDSVHEAQAICGRGITYEGQNSKEFLYAVERASLLYEEKKEMELITAFNLACDFSFDKSAQQYYRIYRGLL